MNKYYLTFFGFAYSFLGFSTIWQAGPSYDYSTPNALYLADQSGEIDMADFDTIYIENSDYSGVDALAAWQQNNLFIQGLGGPEEKPHLMADGENILGKGIWVCVGDNITVENIEFSGATVPDENGAGIRLDGIGLTLRHCYFHDNENGLLTSNPDDGDILIEYCEFGYNGFGDGFTHNMYIGHVNSFTLRYSYSHHTNVGHNVKSRANNNYIQFNLIADEETGNSSRLIDIPNGGYALIQGNSLMQGPSAINNNAVGFGKEGLTNPGPQQLFFVYNTLVNKRVASCNFLDIEEGTGDAYVVNNIFAGSGELVVGFATTFLYNYHHEDISHFEFEAEEVYNYNIAPTSPVIDSGLIIMDGLDAEFVYSHPTDGWPRTMIGDRPDIGAYEYVFPIGIPEEPENELMIYPNPSTGNFYIKTNQAIQKIEVFELNGKRVFSTESTHQFIELNQAPGTYLVSIQTDTEIIQQLFIIEG